MIVKIFKIRDICTIKSGKRLPAGTDFSDYPTDYRYIRARDIKAGRISLDSIAYIDRETKNAIKDYIINSGDVAITIVANIGDIGFATDDCDGINLTENAVRLTKFDENVVYSKYLAYYLGQPFMKTYMENLAAGAAQAKLGIYKIEKIKVQLPEVSIQKAIVHIIEQYDDLIEYNNKRIALLEKAAEELYKEWFVRFRFPGHETAKFVNGLPEGWEYVSVKETFNIFDTKRVPLSSLDREKMKNIYPYYGAAELMDYVDDYIFDGIYLLLGEDGTVITPTGKPMLQYVWGKFWVNNHAHILQGKKPFSTEYLHLMFGQMDINSIVTGAAQPKISQGRLFKKKTVIPTFNLIIRFDAIIQPIYDNIRKLTDTNKNLIKQRDLLLPRLMSGKLEV